MIPRPFLEGLLAGYGIAIPVGPIAVLILDLGLRRGFAPALLAAMGAASADLFYAGVAAFAGPAVATALAPLGAGLQLASALVLLAIGVRGLWRLRSPNAASGGLKRGEAQAAFLYPQFVGLTLLNPITVAYFGALIVGRAAGGPLTAADRIAFVIGAGLATFSWQMLLAGVSALAGRRLPERPQRLASILGSVIVLGFGARVLLGATG